jgi:7-cyano-7-deazaguanine synthase
VILLSIHAGDHNIYPDCRQEFRDADDAAFRINWDAENVGYFTQCIVNRYQKMEKSDVKNWD